MLDLLRKGQRWVTALFVIGIGGVMVFFIGLGAPLQGSSGDALVQVGPYAYGFREFERVRAQRESQYQEALGESFDATALRDTLDEAAVRTLVDRALLAIEARNLGLTVAREEIERSVLAGGGFRDETGSFDRQAFENYTQYEYGNQRNFMAEQSTLLLATKMLRVLNDLSRVSEAETREAVRQRMAEVRIAFVVLDPNATPAAPEIDEARVAEFLATREDEARALYDEHLDRYDVPERVRARHILLRVEPDATAEREQEVRAAAESLLEEIRGGADFAEVARRASEDPGSRESGGDLGFFERGKMVPAFDAAAFSLEADQVSEVIRSEFGFHIIRVEEHPRAEHQPFEAVQEDLAREALSSEAADAANRELAATLAAGIREGRSLEQAARAQGLTLQRSGWLRRRPDGFVSGLGAAPDLIATAFTLAAGESAERIFEVDEKLALLQVLETRAPEAEAVEARIEEVGQELLAEKRRAQTQAWLEARRTALLEGGDLTVNLEVIRGGR